MDHCSQVLYHEYHTSATREYRNIEGNVVDVNVSDGAWSNGLWHLARFIDRYCNVIFCVQSHQVSSWSWIDILNQRESKRKIARSIKIIPTLSVLYRDITYYPAGWNTNSLGRVKKAVIFKENIFSDSLFRLVQYET